MDWKIGIRQTEQRKILNRVHIVSVLIQLNDPKRTVSSLIVEKIFQSSPVNWIARGRLPYLISGILRRPSHLFLLKQGICDENIKF